MKAAVVTAPQTTPIYTDFPNPTPIDNEILITVHASALTNLTRGRASGSHYSASGVYPAVAGTDGVGLTPDGRRVYFAMPDPPNGALAELCPIHPRRCVPIPDSLDDITAAAIANPGMSAWAGLVERAHLVAGETVLINGATGSAGRVAVQLARYLGAATIIATGRNLTELETLKPLGATITIPLNDDLQPTLEPLFAESIHVVLDYLWGTSALAIINALSHTIGDHPVRYVQVGTAAGDPTIPLPGAALRSSAITLMGSGIGSVSREALANSIARIFAAAQPGNFQIATQIVPLSQVEQTWAAAGKTRIVYTIP